MQGDLLLNFHHHCSSPELASQCIGDVNEWKESNQRTLKPEELKPPLPKRWHPYFYLPADSSIIITGEKNQSSKGKKSTNPKSARELLAPPFVSENLPLQSLLCGCVW